MPSPGFVFSLRLERKWARFQPRADRETEGRANLWFCDLVLITLHGPAAAM